MVTDLSGGDVLKIDVSDAGPGPKLDLFSTCNVKYCREIESIHWPGEAIEAGSERR